MLVRPGPAVVSKKARAAAAVNAIAAAMSVAPSAQRRADMNALVYRLQTRGLWAGIESLQIYAAHDEQAARVDWKKPSRVAAAVAAPTFTADKGFTFNGTTQYLTTGVIPSASSTLALNSQALGIWELTDLAAATTYVAGAFSAVSNQRMAMRTRGTGDILDGAIGSSIAVFGSVTTSRGFSVVERGAAAALTGYKNGVSFGAVGNGSGAALCPTEVFVGCVNNNGSAQNFRAAQVSAMVVCRSLSPADHAELYAALDDYLWAIDAVVAFDFVNNRYRNTTGAKVYDPSGVSGWTFTRVDNPTPPAATAEDASGVYQTFADNVPRRTDKGLLVEEARTNLLPYSSPANATGYTDSSGGGTSSPGATYHGGVFSGRIVASNGANWNRRGIVGAGSPTVASGTTYAFSVIYKPGTSGRVRLEFRNAAGTSGSAIRGPVAAPTSVESSGAGVIATSDTRMIDEGLYLWTGTWVPNYSGIVGAGSGVGPDSAAAGETVEFVHFQLEQGAFATSPILTTGAAGTRAGDAAVVSGVSLPAEFTVFVQYRHSASGGRAAAVRGSGGNRLLCTSDSASVIWYHQSGNGTTTNLPSRLHGQAPGGLIKTALRRQAGGYRTAVNGALNASETVLDLPAVTELQIGSESGANFTNSFVEKVVIYPRALSDAELQALTS